MEESALEYGANVEMAFPCEFTPEEKWAILEQARKDEAAGNFIPQDQVLDRYKGRFS
ncbi:MAG: hypothetical protein LUE98_07975 [Tannerellaceae bacterium]|nr:hypothetical protein [Tannerellaceae bacterium]